jgi:predicted DCC family thiol-disulfide oxidoreductase YuxK
VDDSDLIVVAFDGECLMCSRGIRFLAEHDRDRRLRFLRLQDPLGRDLEARAGTAALSTMLVAAGGKVFSRSDGVLHALASFGGLWRGLAALGRLVPRPLRDAGYDFIAARRHRWFGKGDACALPSPALRERLIGGEGV